MHIDLSNDISKECGCQTCTSPGDLSSNEFDKGLPWFSILLCCSIVYLFGLALSHFWGDKINIAIYWVLFLIPYFICGYPVVLSAFKLALKGDVLNEFSLMTISTVAAMAIGELPEAVGVMLFYRIGEYVQELATDKSRTSIKNLLASKPTKATLINEDGSTSNLDVEEIKIGQLLEVKAGEKIPLDGLVEQGSSYVDQSPLTGESVPISVGAGSEVFGGTINGNGLLKIRASKVFSDTHMARILELVENAASNKSKTERFITKFARYYTPIVFLVAALVAIVPPLLFATATFETWLYRALVLLVISCPCALLISVPLGYFGGLGAASKKGILVKGGNVFDHLLKTKTVVFDKTGTLTHGVFEVVEIISEKDVDIKELLEVAACVEQFSNHPVARSIVKYIENEHSYLLNKVKDMRSRARVEELPGKGVLVSCNGDSFLAGNENLLKDFGIFLSSAKEHIGTIVNIAKNNKYLGRIIVSDVIKEDAASGIESLHKMGLSTFMLTGDRKSAAIWVERQTNIGGFWSDLLPEGKVQAMQSISDASSTMFVGDGINDAPILALSGVGVAMGKIGAEAAVEASDVIILNDSIMSISTLFKISHKVRSVVMQNIVLAIGVKTFFMILGVSGISGLWEAVFADVGVALLAVLNSTRVMR